MQQQQQQHQTHNGPSITNLNFIILMVQGGILWLKPLNF